MLSFFFRLALCRYSGGWFLGRRGHISPFSFLLCGRLCVYTSSGNNVDVDNLLAEWPTSICQESPFTCAGSLLVVTSLYYR